MATGKHSTDFKPVKGARMGVVHCGIKKDGNPDLVLFEFDPGSVTAGVFTQSHFAAAPVILARDHLAQQNVLQDVQKAGQEEQQDGQARAQSRLPSLPGNRYFLINSGNANAATGQVGLDDAKNCCECLSQLTGARPEAVLPFSTGVIGERLPVEAVTAGMANALELLAEDNWLEAAKGIMTTDTRPKIASRQFSAGIAGTGEGDDTNGNEATGGDEADSTNGQAAGAGEGQQDKMVTITGIAKGAGMIQPNMATMLAYLATDLDASGQLPLLQGILQRAADKSFNRITIDGDTSTNDSCMLTATGASGITLAECQAEFESALVSLMQELAQGIVRDAEGASKFVTVRVLGGQSAAACLEVAYSIANSPLVKTACFASDANWGRIVMAIGKVMTDIEPGKVDIHIGDVCLLRAGTRAEEYHEEAGAAVMAAEDITITVNLNLGDAAETVWASDLSHDYVSINADYRT